MKKNTFTFLGVLVLLMAGCGFVSRSVPSESTAPAQPAETKTAVTSTAKNRVDLDAKTIETNFATLCKTKFNQDLVDSSALYTNTAEGFTTNLPYNEAWGTAEYRVLPYVDAEGGIDFGPVITGMMEGGCGVRRLYSLRPTLARSIKDIEKQVLSSGVAEKPVVKKYKNVEVVQYSEFGLCTANVFEVIGKKHNYRIMDSCVPQEQSMEKVIEGMLQSFTFIN